MKVHDYIKLAAVVMLIVLTVVAFRREHKHPLLVTKVSEIVVMKAHAEEVEPQKVIVKVRHKVIEEDHARPERPARRERERERKQPPQQTPWALPWSCSKVKWAAETFSPQNLERMRVMNGVAPLTALQHQQAKECIEGKRS